MSVRILIGDALEQLRTLRAGSVQMCVTSPPYFGLRAYGTVPVEWPALSYSPMPGLPPLQIPAMACELGQEPSPEAYIGHMVLVWREVRRVLVDDAVCFINIGDSYASNPASGGTQSALMTGGEHKRTPKDLKYKRPDGLKPKDLCGIPWRLAFALQADGWYLRSDIIWSKPNPMPSSATDRCTVSHEYVFMLAKSERYFFDNEAVKESSVRAGKAPGGNCKVDASRKDASRDMSLPVADTRNKRSVWSISTQGFAEAHFAVYPVELPSLCIKAGTSERGHCPECGKRWVRVVDRTPMVINKTARNDERGTRIGTSGTMVSPASSITLGWKPTCACGVAPVPDVVLDPFGGSGTTAIAADRLQRDAILIELNEGYALMAKNRIHGDAPLLTEIAA